MLIVMPFYGPDIDWAARNLEWAIELDGKTRHDCLLSYPTGLDVSAVRNLAQQYFASLLPDFTYTPLKGVTKWPTPQNWAFQNLARHIFDKVRQPFFWWETDAVLLKPGAFDALEAEWTKSGEKFMGHIVPGSGHMNGVGCYPWDFQRRSVKAMLCREAPWDVVMKGDTIRTTHGTNLIAHRWDSNGNETVFNRYGDLIDLIGEEPVVFHRCKNDSLIKVLKQQRNGGVLKQEVPQKLKRLAVENATDVGVVITTYNRPARCQRALKSCIDAGFTDIVIAVTGRWEPNFEIPKTVQVVRRVKDENANRSWMAGLQASGSTFALLLHDDDVVLPNYLTEVRKHLDANFLLYTAKFHRQKDSPSFLCVNPECHEGVLPTTRISDFLKKPGQLSITPVRGLFKRTDLFNWLQEAVRTLSDECQYRPGFLVGNDLWIWLSAARNYSEYYSMATPLVSLGCDADSTTASALKKEEDAARLKRIYDISRTTFAKVHSGDPPMKRWTPADLNHKPTIPPTNWAVPVTILLPVRNADPVHLRECWQSILAQTHRAWKLLVVNDSDSSATNRELGCIANNPQVKVVRGNGKGLPAALNLGIGLSETELIARMDSDDIMLPNRLEVQVGRFLRDSRLDVLGAQLEMFGTCDPFKTSHPTMFTVTNLLKDNWMINHPSVMYRKSSVQMVGSYNESHTAAEDFGLWMRLAEAGMRLENLPEVLIRYRRHEGQKCTLEPCTPTTERVCEPYRKNRIRVAFVTQALEYGGAEQWLIDLILTTSKCVDWTVIAEAHINKTYNEKLSCIATVLVGDGHKAALDNAQVIIFWYPKHNMSTYAKNARLVMVAHGVKHDAWARTQAKFIFGREFLTLGIGVSRWATEALESLNIRRCVTINNGLPSHYYHCPLMSRDVWRQKENVDGFVVSYLGRLSPEKGFDEVVEASKVVKSPCTIFAAGQRWPPESMPAYTEQIKQLTGGKVKCAGWRGDIAELCSGSDALVIPSRYDSFCYSTLEAWMSKATVISTNTGIAIDNPEWCVPIESNAASIASAIDAVASADPMRQKVDEIALEAGKKYSFTAFQDGWINMLRELANQ